MRSAWKPETKTPRPLTVRVMRLEPRDKPFVPSSKSRRVRKNRWVHA
jgi:hypothetical protein